MLKVYIASKMQHAPAWRELYSAYPDVHIVSRWPFLEPFIEPTENNGVKFWQTDFEDIAASDVLVVYAEPDEHLRGALVEAGIALGLGKWVVLIGEHYDYGTWQFHSRVVKANSISHAFTVAREIKKLQHG